MNGPMTVPVSNSASSPPAIIPKTSLQTRHIRAQLLGPVPRSPPCSKQRCKQRRPGESEQQAREQQAGEGRRGEDGKDPQQPRGAASRHGWVKPPHGVQRTGTACEVAGSGSPRGARTRHGEAQQSQEVQGAGTGGAGTTGRREEQQSQEALARTAGFAGKMFWSRSCRAGCCVDGAAARVPSGAACGAAAI
ncbi:hypothetical protein NDU88_004353 [Pleurodeles waltl]|uniref:Uncharacterized protein n=1 Tax=Pleurodeles waltl TaxID=8319 RepID=A0AAV7T7E2_PLEWA|nr:hypothetical protein NDU88_004353 [Pleurodeles waltl]